MPAYIGRFAPSPTGPLHAGSMVAALASWLDARSHQGQWLVRMEDIDGPRCMPGAAATILQQLTAHGLVPDTPVLYQHTRSAAYGAALNQLHATGLVYPCACTRSQIAAVAQAAGETRQRHQPWVYPGTCRPRPGQSERPISAHVAWRVALPQDKVSTWHWLDRRLGPQQQNLAQEVGDFVLKRSDGLWAYQLAVVVDDADQGITHIVRGEDLADNTPRQQWLQQALQRPTPVYLHTPLVRDASGEKLSKQTHAPATPTTQPLVVLNDAASHLGLPVIPATHLSDWLGQAVQAWAARYS